jgi:enhancing lycopene biosynthesis protein 2
MDNAGKNHDRMCVAIHLFAKCFGRTARGILGGHARKGDLFKDIG